YRSEKAPAKRLKQWTLLSTASPAAARKALNEGLAIAAGMALAKDLGNRPPNDCYPAYLSTVAKDLAKQYPALKARIISEQQAEKLGMGAFCAVARGSEREGQIIVLE